MISEGRLAKLNFSVEVVRFLGNFGVPHLVTNKSAQAFVYFSHHKAQNRVFVQVAPVENKVDMTLREISQQHFFVECIWILPHTLGLGIIRVFGKDPLHNLIRLLFSIRDETLACFTDQL